MGASVIMIHSAILGVADKASFVVAQARICIRSTKLMVLSTFINKKIYMRALGHQRPVDTRSLSASALLMRTSQKAL